MTVRIQDLREQRNSHAIEMRNLVDNNSGKWSKDLQAKYDEHDSALADIDQQIKNAQRVMDLDAESKFGMAEAKAPVANSSSAIYSKWLRHGDNSLNADEWRSIRNTMSTGVPAEGGFTVQTDVATQILDALKSYQGLRGEAEVIRTAMGNPMSFPTSNGTAELGELVAENGLATDADVSFGTLPLNVYKFSSKVVTVPIELLQDSNVDIESFIRQRLVTRLGRITEQFFATGTGVNQPTGLITAATVGVTAATGGTTAVTYDQLIDLQHSVDPSYRDGQGVCWMFNDSTLRSIRKIKDNSGRPIFVPGYETNVPGGMPDTLLGKEICINQNFASMAANAKAIAFGDMSYYKIRDCMDITLFRFTDSAYTKRGQVGFLAWMRSGGNLIDVGGAVKLFQNSAT